MKFEEFVTTSENEVGNRVWICDYRYNDIANKATRHVEPQEVEIFSNESLPKGKTVYYSTIHFKAIGSKGQILSKIIPPFDNTGYRSSTGDAVNVFLTREECVEHYSKQIKEIQLQIEEEREKANARLDKMSKDAEDLLEKFKKQDKG